MTLVGCDLHARTQRVAVLDTILGPIARFPDSQHVVSYVGLAPDAIVIDPGSYTSMLTLKASTSGVYLSGAPLSAAPMALLWGVPVVPSPAMPAGEALVGNFRRGGALYGKNGLRMMASTEHSDFFTKNLTAVLGELHAVLAIQRPPAFAKVTGLPVPTP